MTQVLLPSYQVLLLELVLSCFPNLLIILVSQKIQIFSESSLQFMEALFWTVIGIYEILLVSYRQRVVLKEMHSHPTTLSLAAHNPLFHL